MPGDNLTPTIHHGDCLDIMRSLPDNSVHAIVTDPPYGLGFMGAKWDALPPGLDWAEECLRVLKPGGHLLAFGGTRTWHRLAVAIEDAGFEIRDSIYWHFGSGFPKSHNVSKAIDKAAGAEREVTGPGRWAAVRGVSRGASQGASNGGTQGGYNMKAAPNETAPATDAAKQWEGWGSALKPATEPIVRAQKPFNVIPLDMRLVANVHHALTGLQWLSLSSAKRAETLSTSSLHGPQEATCVSALVNALVESPADQCEKTDTFRSPAAASTFWNIATSWNSILGALSDQRNTSTTSTRSSTTTALRTLNSLLGPLTSQTTMPACECLTSGPASTAQNAESSSSGAWMSWLDTLSASVPETATEGIALAVASALADIAEQLSAGQEAAHTAGESATTKAAASSGGLTEPIVMARKPFRGTLAANVLEHGTGAINVDATRIGGESGRWPANVILDEEMARALDQQSGVTVSKKADRGADGGIFRLNGFSTPEELREAADRGEKTPNGRDARENYRRYLASLENDNTRGHNDSGGASRFFYVAEQDAPFMYSPKAPKKERPDVDGVKHPTVKPLSVMRWLVRLVTPPSGIVLDPFAGSGTTVEAAMLEGFDCIGIEREAEYLPLIHERIRRATEQNNEAPAQGAFSLEEIA